MPRFKIFHRLALACVACAALLPAAEFALQDGDTVVFYGDSITDQRLYTLFTEEYVLTRFPQLHVRFVHSGWGGDRVSGGAGGPVDLRLDRDVIPYKPTVMTIMLGMNDGHYRAFDQDTFQIFATGYQHIIDKVKAALPGIRITAILASPYDDVTRPPLFEGGYNAVLQTYSQYVRELAKRDGLSVADLNTGVVTALQRANASDPTNALRIIPDRVHPGASGHLLMAEALLKSWSAPSLVSEVEMDVRAGSATIAKGTRISDIEKKGRGFSWTQIDAALPMPVDWTDPLVKLATVSSDFVEALDREPLRITGLGSGNYELSIDSEPIGTYSAGQLASGLNLALLNTPMLKQAGEVAQLTVVHGNIHNTRWRNIQVPLAKYDLSKKEAAIESLDGLEEQVIGLSWAAAQPKPHRYKIVPQ